MGIDLPPCYSKDYTKDSPMCSDMCMLRFNCKLDYKKALDSKVVSLTEYRIKHRGGTHESESRS